VTLRGLTSRNADPDRFGWSSLVTPVGAALALTLLSGLPQLACAARSPEPVRHQGPAAADDSLVNTVRWATESHLDYLGYRVYRARTNGGDFAELTEEMIPARGDCLEVCRYEFVDRTNDPWQAYFYLVKVVLPDGSETLFTPIARVAPKRAAAPDGQE